MFMSFMLENHNGNKICPRIYLLKTQVWDGATEKIQGDLFI